MSRVGRKPIVLPQGVEVRIEDNNKVTVKGSKGELVQTLNSDMTITITDGVINIDRPSETKEHKSMHGLTRSLLANMIEGVSEGYQKTLEVVGVGYRVALQGTKLALTLGFSHPVEMQAPKGITFEVPDSNKIIVKGIDKQLVGETAAQIRKIRPPEPYKGKGVKYDYERIRRKEGKSGSAKK